jgi:hypothetical protein
MCGLMFNVMGYLHVFRGITAAASLKRREPLTADVTKVVFRGSDAAASLKHRLLNEKAWLKRSLPRQ